MHARDHCPDCGRGKLYSLRRPGVVVRIVGQAPLAATVFELEKFRCATCGQVFSASAAAAAGTGKYDPTVGALVAVLRFGSGMPSPLIEMDPGAEHGILFSGFQKRPTGPPHGLVRW